MSPSPQKLTTVPPVKRLPPAEFKAKVLRDSVPDEEVKKICDYAARYDLELNEDRQDCSLYSRAMPGAKDMWWINVEWSGIRRICQSTGLWLPGKSELRTVGNDFYAFASCYVRPDTESNNWCEVSDLAKYGSYYQRDIANEDPEKAKKPVGDWALTPEILLDEIAQYRAAAKALGPIVTCHKYAYATPMVIWHDRRKQLASA